MCNLHCKNCNKNNIYLGTSAQNFESHAEFSDFEGVVFTDCVKKARQDAFEKEVLGQESIVVAHAKDSVRNCVLEDISDDDYGFQFFLADSSLSLVNFIAV